MKHMNICTCVHFCPPPPKKEILNLTRFFMREKVALRAEPSSFNMTIKDNKYLVDLSGVSQSEILLKM